MRQLVTITALLLVPALLPAAGLANCPALPDRSPRHIELMELVAKAPDEQTARQLSNELWEIWATAPDEVSQEILNRGMQRRAAYDFVGALSDFGKLIEYCPDYAEGYNQRAFINFIRQDYQTSLIDLDKALERTPDHIGAAAGRALTLLQLGRTREGQLALRDALKLNPWLPERFQLTPVPDAAETEL
ncbi:MAG: hypothetical protein HKP40_05280 [Litoreibacter sp.]|nr:hypothetical protein [Litoreibacter sp.]